MEICIILTWAQYKMKQKVALNHTDSQFGGRDYTQVAALFYLTYVAKLMECAVFFITGAQDTDYGNCGIIRHKTWGYQNCEPDFASCLRVTNPGLNQNDLQNIQRMLPDCTAWALGFSP